MMRGTPERTWILGIITIVITSLVSTALWFGVLNTLQDQLTDRFFLPKSVSSDIIIIDIDEESLAVIGQWPWDRATHAILLKKIKSAQIVAFDLIFSEPSRSGDADDKIFTDAIESFSGRVLLPEVISEQSGLTTPPIPPLAAVTEEGFVNTKPERDGVIRFAEITRAGMPGFDALITGATSCNTTESCAPETIRINYSGPAQTFTTLSYIDVLEGRIPSILFEGKIVLVGVSASGLGDSFQTPFGAIPGVEVHANTIETLQTGTYLQDIPFLVSIFLFAMIALLTFVIVTRVTTVKYLYIVLTIVFLVIVVEAYIAFSFYYVVPHLYELVLFVLLTGALLLVQYVYETKEKAFIRKGFEHYVASEVVKELYENPDKLILGGETRTLSILFSDIRGFTSVSEVLTPQELMSQLNEYLEEMSEAVMQNKGLVDKYIGDAVMAFWGAPLTNANHAVNACESAVAMMKSLDTLNERWAKEGKPPFKIGAGISTGDVVVGNMGSKRRFNYSIIGDEVNFSARIEGLTKEYKVKCLIGSGTQEAIKNVTHLHTRELDDVQVKGKKEPRRIYELLTDELTEKKQKVLKQFALGRQAYLQGDFKNAVVQFSQALEIDSEDGPSQVFLERSQALLTNPPSNWTGVFEFKTK